MPDIFLSYNREDQAAARLFAEAFAREDLDVWWDAELRSGDAYDEVTETALKTAKAVVVLWSRKSAVSRWVRAEATLADRCRKLLPAMIEPCERPIMFELTQTADLSSWRGEAADAAWLAFLADAKRFVARGAPARQAIANPGDPPAIAPLSELDVDRLPAGAGLPFGNRSGLEEDEIYADGMADDVIAALAQGVGVRVLSGFATAALKNAAITDLAAIGRQLGVDYLLEGNVRRAGPDLRVAAQLLKPETGAVVWSARFDQPLADLATLQEALVLDLAASLGAQVFSAEMERALAKPDGLTAWETRARLFALIRNVDPPAMRLALAEAQRLIDSAPKHGAGYTLSAFVRSLHYFVMSPDDEDEVKAIRILIDRGVGLTPQDPIVTTSAAMALVNIGAPEEAARWSRQALARFPGNGMAFHALGVAMCMLGRIAEAHDHLAAAERMMPGTGWATIAASWRGNTLVRENRLVDAEAAYDRCLEHNPQYWPAWQHKAVNAWRGGRRNDARLIYRRLKDAGNWFAFSAAWYARVFVNSDQRDGILDAVRGLEADSAAAAIA